MRNTQTARNKGVGFTRNVLYSTGLPCLRYGLLKIKTSLAECKFKKKNVLTFYVSLFQEHVVPDSMASALAPDYSGWTLVFLSETFLSQKIVHSST